MSLMPWRPLRDLSREMMDLFERGPFPYWGEWKLPRVDIYQTESEVIVRAEIPGVDKQDLQLYVDEHTVRLAGQFKQSEEFKDEHIYRSERHYGSFSRAIPLPVEVKPERAKAEYRDGILSVTIDKKEPGKQNGRHIDIQ
ncbi:MAG: Hsp20/alpha crystallin family protein [Firmicutes bacterium]|nr:Hsp20/alpha crystallin family protein [Bacillota bacterium]